MSAPWVFVPPKTWPTFEPTPGYFGTAPHLRGRVRKSGRLWLMEVVNHHTGQVIASDNCIVWRTSMLGANDMTGAARGAWTHRYRQKDLK